MTLLEVGNYGYQMGATGIIAFSVAFLIAVRWWSDYLGRIIAMVLFSLSFVLTLTILRMVSPDLAGDHTYLAFRAIGFWFFGLSIWSALGAFVWTQFFAPRLRQSKRKSNKEE